LSYKRGKKNAPQIGVRSQPSNDRKKERKRGCSVATHS
jgi:hypothetical protein